MVVPVEQFVMPAASMEAPLVVKEYHAIWWYILDLLFCCSCVARFVAIDIFGAFNTALMALLAWYLVSDNCAKMSQCCVLYFGTMSFTSGVFDFLPLVASLNGRVTESTENGKARHVGTRTYTVTIEKHPFFDGSMGYFYNYQSCVMMISPIVMFAGAVLAYKSYMAFNSSLFEETDDEAAGGVGGAGQWPAGGGQLAGVGRSGGSSRSGHTLPRSFEGKGHRLN